jgi:catechol 2,3-dioxygenase-like lactoylglutathione lyase family enzyme
LIAEEKQHMHIDSLDHLVLTVRDIAATCDFYTRILGMHVVTFDDNRRALHFGTQKINLHEAGNEFEPKALKPTSGSADFCLLTSFPLEQVIAHLQTHNILLVKGPVQRTGATGPIMSVYVRDPDGNLVEIANTQR